MEWCVPNFTPELYIETTLYEHMVTSHVSEKKYSNCQTVWVLFCACMITDACKYTCRFVSTIQKALTQMNAHTNAHVHTTTYTCTCNTQICIYIYAHNITHTSTHNTMCTQDGACPLHIASQEGHDRTVEMLLQAGATVDLQDKVEDCYYLFICHLCCPMCIIHCTLSMQKWFVHYRLLTQKLMLSVWGQSSERCLGSPGQSPRADLHRQRVTRLD